MWLGSFLLPPGEIAFATSDEQPLEGKVMGLRCHLTKTQEGKDFTVHTWDHREVDPTEY
jgi:hypothetical protein